MLLLFRKFINLLLCLLDSGSQTGITVRPSFIPVWITSFSTDYAYVIFHIKKQEEGSPFPLTALRFLDRLSVVGLLPVVLVGQAVVVLGP